ncbi:hypothetical protein JOB18_022822 [Solea senegalensis]|uniref:Transmembrane protein n=1 Tax=Solea senegalensis TaxID=28829 RepID=A0AAV6QU39_SOLSE|nr:hypothetical protein JOB18_022822 [Solea senegalensis]
MYLLPGSALKPNHRDGGNICGGQTEVRRRSDRGQTEVRRRSRCFCVAGRSRCRHQAPVQTHRSKVTDVSVFIYNNICLFCLFYLIVFIFYDKFFLFSLF